MRKELIINLPNGYRLIRREKVFPIQKAEEILCSRRKKKLTSAVRQGDEAVITSHVIECPYCRSQVPAYHRYVGRAPTVTRDTIKKWAEPQYSLFEDSNNKLILNIVYDPKENYICPRCKQESLPFRENTTVRLLASSKKAIINCSTTDLKSVIELSKKTRLQISKINFPLSEELEFNLRNGHSSISIKDCNSNTLLVADITTGSVDWSCTSLYKLIDTNALIKRKLYKAFSWLYTGHIPFTADDLSPRNAVAMTRFRGFSRIFYDSIPYDLTDGMIDSSFNALAREIRTENDLPGILKRSSIPNTKSIKRTMFSNPGLFFYISELEKNEGDPITIIRI